MNLPLFIARKIHFSKGEDNRKVTPPVIRIAMAGVALGLAVMILAVAIVVGFKKERTFRLPISRTVRCTIRIP